MLEVSHINTFYGRIQCLWDVSLKIDQAEIVALIGANGAGKIHFAEYYFRDHSPCFRERSTFWARESREEPRTKSSTWGLLRFPKAVRPLLEMSVRENLEMGAYAYRAWQQKAETHQRGLSPVPQAKRKRKPAGPHAERREKSKCWPWAAG